MIKARIDRYLYSSTVCVYVNVCVFDRKDRACVIKVCS